MPQPNPFNLFLSLLFYDCPRLIHLCRSEFDDISRFKEQCPDFLRSHHFGKRIDTTQNRLSQLDLDAYIAQMHAQNIALIDWTAPEYPSLLKQISDPPLVLHCEGDITALQRQAIAIVGSRKASSYAKDVVTALIPQLPENLLIVSGLAMGVDTLAHQQSLKSNRYTVAVLGHGHKHLNPSRNWGLRRSILSSGGAIISEYPYDTPALPHFFPQRNRIISGLCRAVIVVEASLKSGALITARLANEQNRDVFAVPGPIFSPLSEGPHSIIQDGAKLLRSVADIRSELPDLFDSEPDDSTGAQLNHSLPNCSELEQAVLSQLDYSPQHIDTLASTLDMPIPAVLGTLTVLQFKQLIVHSPGQYYQKKGTLS